MQIKRFSIQDKLLILERIENGELLEDISIEQSIGENTLRRWCKLFKVLFQ